MRNLWEKLRDLAGTVAVDAIAAQGGHCRCRPAAIDGDEVTFQGDCLSCRAGELLKLVAEAQEESSVAPNGEYFEGFAILEGVGESMDKGHWIAFKNPEELLGAGEIEVRATRLPRSLDLTVASQYVIRVWIERCRPSS